MKALAGGCGIRDEEAEATAQANNGYVQYSMQRSSHSQTKGEKKNNSFGDLNATAHSVNHYVKYLKFSETKITLFRNRLIQIEQSFRSH